MLKNFSLGGIAALILFSFSCKQSSKNNFEVTISFSNADKLISPLSSQNSNTIKVYLEEVPYGRDQSPLTLDSTKLSGKTGTVTLRGTGKSEGIYEVVFGENLLEVPLINDAQEIKLNIDLARRDDFYQVSGSDASKQLQELISNIGQKNHEVEKAFADLDSLKRLNAPDSVTIAATQLKNNAIEGLNNYLKHFISTSSNPTLGILALSWGRSLSKSDFETALNGLQKKFPDNVVLQNMKKSYDMQQAEAEKKINENSWIGKQAPELSLPDANGKNISLSSFKGKYVLVDFWASWCGPCRMENPNVVKVYDEFKNKNFTILGVSLDKENDPWLQAIKDDNLTWTHVSDLKYWSSEAVNIFKFEGIPFNILIDPQGKIIAQELRGDNLENKLKEILK